MNLHCWALTFQKWPVMNFPYKGFNKGFNNYINLIIVGLGGAVA